MPEISRFFGIVVRMFGFDADRHHRPHFHVEYQGEKASYGIDPVEMIAGSLPISQQRSVEEWAELHQDELMENWHLLVVGKPANKIDPLT